MKQEDEQYFTVKMLKLADIFNQMVEFVDKSNVTDLEKDPKIIEMQSAYTTFAEATWEEFSKAGYGDDDWNKLIERSGTAQRMGMA